LTSSELINLSSASGGYGKN